MSLKEDINYSIWCDFIERDFLENEFPDVSILTTVCGGVICAKPHKEPIGNSSRYCLMI